MASAAEPEFRPGFVDRVLVCAAACGLPAALIFNKIDLGVKPEDEELLDVYRGLGVEVFKISVADIGRAARRLRAAEGAAGRHAQCAHRP